MAANDSSSRDHELLDRLVEEFNDRLRKGERPSVREYCEQYPALAGDLRDLLPAVAQVEGAKDAPEAPDAPPAPAAVAAPVLEHLGDFHILREIGHGGMGVVYEAEQISLGRRVALKVLTDRLLRDDKQKRRFEREARSAARLHHTNIVPVFGTGEHRGTPYYVMQYIQGLGLDVVIGELAGLKPGEGTAALPGTPEVPRSAATVARREAPARQMARSLMTGVFRGSEDSDPGAGDPGPATEAFTADPARPVAAATTDPTGSSPDPSPPTEGLGPANTSAVTSGVTSGVSSGVSLPGLSESSPGRKARKLTYWQSVARVGVQVADALAYAHGQGVIHRDIKPSNLILDMRGTVWVTDFGLAKAEGTDNLTHTGDVLGTLRYMPPEAFDGQSGVRGDVYSLGLTLYELLTHRPAFDEVHRQKLIKQVTEAEPPRLRKLVPAIPRDLATVIGKAIEKDPARRYPTAGDLGADLQRFLDDEPVRARQQTQVERYARWARRNPGIAVLGGVLTGVLVLVTVASLLAAGYFNRLRLNEAQAAQSERDARHEAELSREAESEQRQEAEKARAEAVAALKEADAQRAIASQQREVVQGNLYNAQMHLAQQAWREHRGLGHMRELLAGWLPRGESPDRRGWEWFYLHSLPYQNLRTLAESGVRDKPATVAWHVATNRLAVGTTDGSIRLWDVGREQMTLVLHGPGPAGQWRGTRWCAWSPDGARLVAGFHDGTVHAWETSSGRELGTFRGHTSPVEAVACSADGTRVAAWGSDGAIKIWDVATGRLTADVTHPGGVSAGAWSPDGERLASGHQDGTVTVSDTRKGGEIVTLRGHVDFIGDLEWSPDGTRIASGSGDFTARVWEVASGKVVLGPLRHSHGVESVAWQPGGRRLATGSVDETVKVWDAATGREAVTLRGHLDAIRSLAWGPDGSLASGAGDGSVRIWTSVRDQEASVLPGHGVRATAVSWSPNGRRLASAGDDGRIRIWDPATREEVLAIKGHDEQGIVPQFGLIRSLAWSPDGTRLASGSLDGTARVWDAAGGREVFALPADRGRVWSVAWSPDGTRLAVGSEDGTIRVAEGLQQTSRVRSFRAHRGRARGVAWSPRGDRLASVGADGLVKLWDPIRGTELSRLQWQGPLNWVLGVAWSPDGGRLASGHAMRVAVAWDAQTGRELATLRGHNDFVDAVAWNPDATRLATAGLDNSVRVWNPVTGEETLVLRGHSGMFHDVAWHPDGAQLAAAGSDGQVWIWDATRGFERDTTPRALPFIDRRVASGSARGLDRRWFAESYLRAGMPAKALALVDGDRPTEDRYLAARAAALAAAGQGRGEPPLDDAAKAKLRRQALDWLRAELTARRKLLEADPPRGERAVVPTLSHWKQDRDLAGLCDPAALAKLPADEREAWTRLWADVDALDTPLSLQSGAPPLLRTAALQAWFAQDGELAETCARALRFARDTKDPTMAERTAKICSLRPADDKTHEAALVLARRAVELGRGHGYWVYFQMALGMAEYRAGHYAEAEAALLAASKLAGGNDTVVITAAFYRAMSLFRQGREAEARRLMTDAAARMRPLPADDKVPLAGSASADDLILWMAYKEARSLLMPARQSRLPDARPGKDDPEDNAGGLTLAARDRKGPASACPPGAAGPAGRPRTHPGPCPHAAVPRDFRTLGAYVTLFAGSGQGLPPAPPTDPDVCIRMHTLSPLPRQLPGGLRLASRHCCNWPTGARHARGRTTKEVHHAPNPGPRCPPPRPGRRRPPAKTAHVWAGIPAEDRQRVLNALSRVVTEHLMRSPAPREVTHD